MIVASDLHLRPDTPKARTDDFQKAQWRKLDQIGHLCRSKDELLVLCGDIGHRPFWPNWMEVSFRECLRDVEVALIVGQHDLSRHNMESFKRTAMGVFCQERGELLGPVTPKEDGQHLIYGCSFGQEPRKVRRRKGFTNVLIVHKLLSGKREIPDTPSAKDFLKTWQRYYDLIFVGDNHEAFEFSDKGTIVSPGSMMRQSADQTDHKPRVLRLVGKRVRSIPLEVEPDVLTRDHIERKEARELHQSRFADSLAKRKTINLDFETAVREEAERSKELSERAKAKALRALEEA